MGIPDGVSCPPDSSPKAAARRRALSGGVDTTELRTIDLPGRRLRQLADDDDLPGNHVRRGIRDHVVANRLDGVAGRAVAQRDDRQDYLANHAVGIVDAERTGL